MIRFLRNEMFSIKKKGVWYTLRCPYQLCPSNQPFREAKKARLKYVQKVAPTVVQFKCKDCGLLLNYDSYLEQEDVTPQRVCDSIERMCK